ncbi:hypothetical protein, partial [Alicyclobacillus sendaiensis]|uniref:hypothetical protein n=1 Tax=Alicyclobacillus sendaiensis TaxID=192387 RepID=UPI001C3F3B58
TIRTLWLHEYAHHVLGHTGVVQITKRVRTFAIAVFLVAISLNYRGFDQEVSGSGLLNVLFVVGVILILFLPWVVREIRKKAWEQKADKWVEQRLGRLAVLRAREEIRRLVNQIEW